MFFISWIFLRFSQSVIIMHTIENTYMTLVDEPCTYIKLTSDIGEAIDVTFTDHINGLIFIKETNNPDQVFNISSTKKLRLYSFNGLETQQFVLKTVDNDNYNIMNRGECLTYDQKTSNIILKPCTNSHYQLFTIKDSRRENNDVYPYEDNYYANDFREPNPERSQHYLSEPTYHNRNPVTNTTRSKYSY
uniref:Ricin B lectin domain-containing protein n=1 Tax=Nosema pernyi TaxID=1112939 RepID=X5E6A1_9MICR|nr:hypothetical protein NP_c51 [Nosema pernyi]